MFPNFSSGFFFSPQATQKPVTLFQLLERFLVAFPSRLFCMGNFPSAWKPYLSLSLSSYLLVKKLKMPLICLLLKN